MNGLKNIMIRFITAATRSRRMGNDMKIFSIALFAVVLSGCATTTFEARESVFEITDVSQQEIYTRARLWIAETFVSAKDVITFDDADLGIVKGTAIGEYGPALDWWEWYVEFRYSFSVYTRDGGAKLDINGVRRIGEYPSAGLKTDILAEYFDALAEDFRQFISREISTDW